MILGQYDIDNITIIDCNGAVVSANAKKTHQRKMDINFVIRN